MKEHAKSVTQSAVPYWRILKLDKDPFMEGTLYRVPSWQTHDELLSHLCQYNHAMKLVIGSAGVGKTSFIQGAAIHRQASPLVMLNGQKTLMLETLLSKLESGLATKERLVDPEQLLPLLASEKKRLLVVIDQAHLISPSLLAIFCHWIKANTEGYLQLILVGQPVLMEQLQRAYGGHLQKITQVIKLQPFDLQETKDYLWHRLQQAGWTESTLEPDFIRRVFKASKGVAAVINPSAQKWLTAQLIKPSFSLRALLLRYPYRWLLVACGLLLTSMFGLYLYYQSQIIEPMALSFDRIPSKLIEDEAMMEAESAEEAQSMVKTPELLAAQAAEPSMSTKNSTAATPLPLAHAHDGERVLATNGQYYTIQLLGGRDFNILKSFVDQHHLADQASIIETKLHQKVWYILIYGTYINKAEAAQALHDLPEGLKETRPWLRPYSHLHILIRNRKPLA